MICEVQFDSIFIDIRDLVTPAAASIRELTEPLASLSDDEFTDKCHTFVANAKYRILEGMMFPSQALAHIAYNQPLDCVPRSLLLASLLRTRFPPSDVRVVFGILLDHGRQKHAWVELDDKILESTRKAKFDVGYGMYCPELRFNDIEVL